LTYIDFTVPMYSVLLAFYNVLPLVIIVDAVGIYMLMFKENMDPRSFVLWLMIILAFPFGGFVLYLLFGCKYVHASLFHRKFRKDSETGMTSSTSIPGADRHTEGNEVAFFGRIGDSLPELERSLRGAARSVHIEIYRIPREVDLSELVELACEKARAGLDVRLLAGRIDIMSKRALNNLRDAGVRFQPFHTFFYTVITTRFRYRNERMMAVIDGSEAFVGSESVMDIRGPAASRLEMRFLADWAHAAKKPMEDVQDCAGNGDVSVQVVSSGPDLGSDVNPGMAEYVSMLSASERSVLVSVPFLVPEENIYNFLKLSALSGSEVSVIIPRDPKHWYQAWNSKAASVSLLKSGVRVFFTRERLSEGMMVVDTNRTAMGLAPFNSQSLELDFHTSVIVASD
jgi:cardiolipin synthase